MIRLGRLVPLHKYDIRELYIYEHGIEYRDPKNDDFNECAGFIPLDNVRAIIKGWLKADLNGTLSIDLEGHPKFQFKLWKGEELRGNLTKISEGELPDNTDDTDDSDSDDSDESDSDDDLEYNDHEVGVRVLDEALVSADPDPQTSIPITELPAPALKEGYNAANASMNIKRIRLDV